MINFEGLTMNQLAERNASLVSELEQLRKITNCPAGVDLHDHLKALVAENVALKTKANEVLKEAAYVYSHYNRMVDHLDGESVDGQTLHELQELLSETPATDSIAAELKAQGVEAFALLMRKPGDDAFLDAMAAAMADTADTYARQLREGAK